MGKGFVNVSGGGGSEDKIKKLEEGLENHTHDKIVFVDDRNDGVTPENTTPGITVHLKNNTADGLNVGGSLHSVITVRSWHDMTGPKIHELGFTDNGILAHRYSTGDGTWSEWSYVAHQYDLANYLPLGGGTMTGALCVGKHTRLSEAAGDSWGTFTLDSIYGDGFARLALICYGTGSDPGAIIQLFKANGEFVKDMRLIHEGNIGSQTVNKAKYASITTPGTASLKNIKAGTSDLTAGSSALTTGDIYLVYE